MAKALVTGGCGFIGSHLVERLAELGHEVVVLDSLIKGNKSSIQYLIDSGKVKFIEGDIRSIESVDDAMEGVDYVFHCAAIHVQRSAESPSDCNQVNIDGSWNVFYSAYKHKVKKVIFSSSSSIYGNPKKLPMNEEDQCYPAEPYGSAKQYSEYLLKHLQRKGLNWIALRYYNVYGERQKAHASVVINFIQKVMKNESPIIDGKGEQSFDFCYVSDVVDANILSMDDKINNEIFNVGTGVSTTIADVADIIINALDKNIKPTFKDRVVYVSRRQADITKAQELLGFVAKVKAKQGLTDVAKEIASNPAKYGN
jgi:UDP-glucose 4-epimerase